MFYRTLKNLIKNEIILYNKPDIINKFVTLIIKIDNKQFE